MNITILKQLESIKGQLETLTSNYERDYKWQIVDVEDLLEDLETYPKDSPVVAYNFENKELIGVLDEYNTYRGDYAEGSISHTDVESASSVLDIISTLSPVSNGVTLEGYKGGSYFHHKGTYVYLANEGEWSQVEINTIIEIKVNDVSIPVFLCSKEKE